MSEKYVQSADGKWHVIQDDFPEPDERIRPPLLNMWEILADIIKAAEDGADMRGEYNVQQ